MRRRNVRRLQNISYTTTIGNQTAERLLLLLLLALAFGKGSTVSLGSAMLSSTGEGENYNTTVQRAAAGEAFEKMTTTLETWNAECHPWAEKVS